MEIFDTKLQKECSLGVWTSGALTDFFPDEISASQQYSMLLINDRVGNTPTIFLRNGIFEKIGYYDEEFPWVEDYPFWLKATKAGTKIYFMDLVTVNYRRHIASVHNNGIVQFMLPSYFLNEKLRKKYIYPNLGHRLRLHKKYGYTMAIIFKFFTGNKYHPAISKTYNFLTFQSNFYTRLFQS
jgi:alpha-1,3-rhamnosyltransferase